MIYLKSTSKVIAKELKHVMVFKRPITDIFDFYVIPNFTNYSISEKGIVRSIKTGKILEVRNNAYGYPSISIYDPDKTRYRDICLHILLAWTFVENVDPEEFVYVNHKDGDKQNFSLDNLEWVTSKENNEHARNTGLATDQNETLVFDTKFNQIHRFRSRSMACEFMGIAIKGRGDEQFFRKIYGKRVYRLLNGRYWAKFSIDPFDWPNKIQRENTLNGPYETKHIETGRIFSETTVKRLAEKIGVKKSLLDDSLRKTDNRVTDGYLVRVKKTDPWPDFLYYPKPRK